MRTTRTRQWACRTTESETLPIKALPIPPEPRLPTTTSPTPRSSASSTISAAGVLILKCARVTVPPYRPDLLTLRVERLTSRLLEPLPLLLYGSEALLHYPRWVYGLR